MSITHRNDDPVATIQLDFEQRAALRREVALTSHGTDDIARNIERGDREDAVSAIGELQGMIALLDAIGWCEPSDAPHIQSVNVSDAAAWWATVDRRTIVNSLANLDEVGDDDLDDDLLVIAAYDQFIAAVA